MPFRLSDDYAYFSIRQPIYRAGRAYYYAAMRCHDVRLGFAIFRCAVSADASAYPR